MKASTCCAKPGSFTGAAEVFKALGHPTRTMVVAEIGDGERCVCELTELAGCDMSTMSNHLAVLKAAGVLRSERRGARVFYSVALGCVLELLSCVARK
ncbi:MAG: winged helix-turn-helix transcriptional regulator [Planctomycetes bacterium]|nr:winged helix-turn-helix transcriptional regulator [Planctomycetota bacterium]